MRDDLPDPFDVDQLRRRAKELRRDARGGDRRAVERIRVTHPRFGRRRPTGDDIAALTLRDAQLCVARELGFDGWRDVLAHAQGAAPDRTWRRWPDHASSAWYERVGPIAQEAGWSHMAPELALGALLRPPVPTLASEVLVELGLTWEKWLAAVGHPSTGKSSGLHSTIPWQTLLAFAEGLALADGATESDDQHLLLALVYHRASQFESPLERCGLDPDGIVAGLARRGIAVSDLRPPAPARALGRFGPRVYFPAELRHEVMKALMAQFPPGSGAHWGWNTDGRDRQWVDGEADVDLPAVIAAAVPDPSVLQIEERPRQSG